MKNKTTMLLLTFFAGAIIGAAIVWLSCICCCKSSCCPGQCAIAADTTGLLKVNDSAANVYFKAYLTSPDSVIPFKAFTINYKQFNAMKLIANADSTVHGFRIYMGMNNRTPVRLVVGTGSPDKVSTIYMTTDEGSGPCPYVCDDSSPITDK